MARLDAVERPHRAVFTQDPYRLHLFTAAGLLSYDLSELSLPDVPDWHHTHLRCDEIRAYREAVK